MIRSTKSDLIKKKQVMKRNLESTHHRLVLEEFKNKLKKFMKKIDGELIKIKRREKYILLKGGAYTIIKAKRDPDKMENQVARFLNICFPKGTLNRDLQANILQT